jgi:hypothetical protein
MNDQIHNYAEPHFCRVFKDMDILFLQVCLQHSIPLSVSPFL